MNRKTRIAPWIMLLAPLAGGWASGALAQQAADTGGDTDTTEQLVEQTLQQRTMGYGPGAGGYGYSPCPYGMGPGAGMMGQGMMGPGMMGPGGGMMGPGMMGPGMGMMGQGMMGPGAGMMGPRGGMMMGPMSEFAMLDLSDAQQQQINRIRQETMQKHMGLRQQIMGERQNMRQLLLQDRPDPSSVGDAYDRIAKLRRQMIESRVEAHNRMEGLLTDEQRQQLQRARQGMMPGAAPGAGQDGGAGQGAGGQQQ